MKSFQYLQCFCLPDRYQMVINVNITCLLALASVYMGVATSLPSTANIKPVEFYLIYNLIYPFLTIILAVYLQVGHPHHQKGCDRLDLCWMSFSSEYIFNFFIINYYLESGCRN